MSSKNEGYFACILLVGAFVAMVAVYYFAIGPVPVVPVAPVAPVSSTSAAPFPPAAVVPTIRGSR